MASLEQNDKPQEHPPVPESRSAVTESQDYQKSNPGVFKLDQSANDKLINSGALPAIAFGQFDGRMDAGRMSGQNGFKLDGGTRAYEGGQPLMAGIVLTRENTNRVASREVGPDAQGSGGEARKVDANSAENQHGALTKKLMDAKSTPQERLEAARELVKSGVTKIDTTMQDGSRASLRLDSTKAGSKEMVHVFANKAGRENVALRGNFDESGALSKQQNNGKSYSYEGKGQRELSRMTVKPAEANAVREPQIKAPARAPETPVAPARTEEKPASIKPARPEAPVAPEVKVPAKVEKAGEQPEPDKKDGDKPEQIKLKDGRRPIVVLDAGHGGTDSGAVVNGLQEKEFTRAMTDLVTKKLQERGVFVEHTNPVDNYISPTERRERADRERGAIAGRKPAEQCQADAAVSIHANHDGVHNKGGGKTRGLEVLLNGGKGKDGTLDLAKSIQGSVNAEKDKGLDVVDGGLRNRPGLAFTKALSPTVLVEAGYMTNNRDLANLKDPVYREKLATAITNGIGQFLQNRPANCRK